MASNLQTIPAKNGVTILEGSFLTNAYAMALKMSL
jgi:hypothetical protein